MKRRGIFAMTCLLCVAGWLASTAAACHSEVSASINCSGVVNYTASAWNQAGATTAQRTNSNVQVSASTDGHTFSPVGSGHFGRDNNFSFGGSFTAAASASTVWVKVQELANWGSGDSPAPARVVQVTKSGCGSSGGTTCPSTNMVQPTGPITVSGGVATVRFTIASGCTNIELSLVSYKAPSATFTEETASQQVKYASQTCKDATCTGVLSVPVPNCYYQVDFVYGQPIDQLGPAGSNNFYGKQGRLISAVNGGTASCTSTPGGGGTGGTSTPSAPPAPAIAVQKLERIAGTPTFVAGPLAVKVGQTIEYQINVKDTGNVMLWVTVTDALCDAGTLSSPSGQGVGPTNVVSFTCSHVAKAGDVGTLTNTATATGVVANGTSVTGTATAVAQVTAATTPAAAGPTAGVAGVTHTVHKPAAKKPAKKAAKKPVHRAKKAAVKGAHHTKVTKKAKPAKAVVRNAHFTG